MIKLTIGDQTTGFINHQIIQSLIDGGTATLGFRTAELFYEKYVSLTFPDQNKWSNWEDGLWREYWFAFWRTVKRYFISQKPSKADEIWNTKNTKNLTKGVSLRLFQKFFMERMIQKVRETKDATTSFKEDLVKTLGEDTALIAIEKRIAESNIPSDIDDFKTLVEEWLEKFPVNVFLSEWVTSLDDATGQDDLSNVFKRAMDDDKFRCSGQGVFR